MLTSIFLLWWRRTNKRKAAPYRPKAGKPVDARLKLRSMLRIKTIVRDTSYTNIHTINSILRRIRQIDISRFQSTRPAIALSTYILDLRTRRSTVLRRIYIKNRLERYRRTSNHIADCASRIGCWFSAGQPCWGRGNLPKICFHSLEGEWDGENGKVTKLPVDATANLFDI
jgi:hypothetical protein